MKLKYLFLIVIVFLASCATERTTTLVSCNYNKSKNQTEYLVFPYGSVSIPGEWNKTTYNQVSKQQFFKNADNIGIAVAFGSCNKYEFNRDNSKKGFDFVVAFYEWDSEFFESNYGLTQEKIEADEKKKYIIWRAYGEIDNSDFDTYFLFGEKNGYANSFSITGKEWDKEMKVNFIRSMYLEENINENQ